jgi:fructokinase
MYDIVSLGETLIDFTPSGKSSTGMDLFAANPGGAPANMLAMNTKLGGRNAFIGMVGKDAFGDFLELTMVSAGIDCRNLIKSEDYHTTLAFVHLDSSGNRSFSFYRKPGADIMLTWNDVDRSLLEDCRIFHFGGVSLTDEPVASTTLMAASYARDHGALISYDPNYRPALWNGDEAAAVQMKKGLEIADIIKVSYEEMVMLSGEKDIKKGAAKLLETGSSLVMVTLGPEGSCAVSASGFASRPAYPVATIDTTGAGDAFLGAVLYKLGKCSRQDLSMYDSSKLGNLIEFGNATGSLTTTGLGAIPSMPEASDIENLMRANS